MTNEPLDPTDATQFIRDTIRFGEVDLTPHAIKQMKARDFDLNDLLLVLSNGEVTEAPEYDEEHQNFKYRVTGPTLDEDLATAIVVLLDHRTVCIITIF